jgi:hypothetical protein
MFLGQCPFCLGERLGGGVLTVLYFELGFGILIFTFLPAPNCSEKLM